MSWLMDTRAVLDVTQLHRHAHLCTKLMRLTEPEKPGERVKNPRITARGRDEQTLPRSAGRVIRRGMRTTAAHPDRLEIKKMMRLIHNKKNIGNSSRAMYFIL